LEAGQEAPQGLRVNLTVQFLIFLITLYRDAAVLETHNNVVGDSCLQESIDAFHDVLTLQIRESKVINLGNSPFGDPEQA
jgi:hypothetical protein